MATININPVTAAIKNKFNPHLNNVFVFPHESCYNLPFCTQSHTEDRKWGGGLEWGAFSLGKKEKTHEVLISYLNDTFKSGIRNSE